MSSTLVEPLPPSLWNDTSFKTYLFDAFSILLPEGEAFVMAASADAARTLPAHSPLQEAVRKFVAEEQAHQRAHRLYNQRLANQSYPVQDLEQRIARDLKYFCKCLAVPQRLCLAAAFEHISSAIAKAATRNGRGWLSTRDSPQVRLWRWHCAEEVAHAHVTLDLLEACRIPYWQRLSFYLLASVHLVGDVLLHMRAFHRADKARAAPQATEFWPSAIAFLAKEMCARQVVSDWARYFLPLRRQSAPSVVRAAEAARSNIASSPCPRLKIRFLQAGDIPALLALERKKWEPGQAATADDMHSRIARYPHLSLGAFNALTGEAIASMFMKPTSRDLLMQSANWQECSGLHPDEPGNDLFGISLSSTHPEAADALFEFFWPHALKAGWRHIYLGSPLPGFNKWLESHPGGSVYRYVHSGNRPRGSREYLPRDPQLRYYSRRGFREIVYIRPDYFPHAASRDYGVLIRGTVPLSLASPLWRRLPVSWLNGLRKALFLLL